LNYDLIVEELTDYDSDAIKDIFVRMNKYVVKLSPQELRSAQHAGAFHDYAKTVGHWTFWNENGVFSGQQIKRMRPAEYAAELAILLIEGPQDKKAAVDLYYGKYQKDFSDRKWVERQIRSYLSWIESAIPSLSSSRFRKPVDLYGLIGALSEVTSDGKKLNRLNPERCGNALEQFATATAISAPSGDAAKYVLAASRQTDNITPRKSRIDILTQVIKTA
jgi:hypothetical protein